MSETSASTVEQNKAIFRRLIDGLFNQKNLAVADELFAPDSASPSAPYLPPGPDGAKAVASMFYTAFPDLQITIDLLVAEGDKVVGRMTERGTHRGEFMGTPPTGKEVTFTEIGELRIENGKITESWYIPDMLGLLQQLGVIPPPGQAAH